MHLKHTPFASIDITWLNVGFISGNTMICGLALLIEKDKIVAKAST